MIRRLRVMRLITLSVHRAGDTQQSGGRQYEKRNNLTRAQAQEVHIDANSDTNEVDTEKKNQNGDNLLQNGSAKSLH